MEFTTLKRLKMELEHIASFAPFDMEVKHEYLEVADIVLKSLFSFLSTYLGEISFTARSVIKIVTETV